MKAAVKDDHREVFGMAPAGSQDEPSVNVTSSDGTDVRGFN
jgi:hypothetical protein